jgi:hypothetical protein
MQTFELCMDETTPNQWVLIWLLGSFYNTPEQIHLQENSTWEVAFLAAQDARLAGASCSERNSSACSVNDPDGQIETRYHPKSSIFNQEDC